MNNKTVRVRFAPAPTGMMHLGNIRAALINYLFAHQKSGSFVLRIEDTDPQRNFDPGGIKIMEDLAWLNLSHDEGPQIGGPYAPYFQSKRTDMYEQQRRLFEEQQFIYRCFCTQEDLTTKRRRQQALKLPPRYDKTCLHLSTEKINERLNKKTPFIWRFKLDHDLCVTISDLARGTIDFELQHFSDFPITRQNGSFTFMFANFVDDLSMNITHVFRGEDHLSNTAGQAALYHAAQKELPLYWHMPILCNTEGKKLSKRDFGFSLRDLKDAGYVPEAIVNYLAIIGGSFKDEIMSLKTLINCFDFENIHATGHITYDIEKLKWINRKWIDQYDPATLTNSCRPFIEAAYEKAQTINNKTLTHLLQIIKTEMITLNDCVDKLAFYFSKPKINKSDVHSCVDKKNTSAVTAIINSHINRLAKPVDFVNAIKKDSQEQNIPLRELFWFLRLALMGSTKGPGIHELIEMLGVDEAQSRITTALDLLGRI